MSVDLATVLPVLAVLFTAALVRSFVGFGDAVVGMPLLALAVSVRTAAPLVGLVAVTLAVVLTVRLRRAIAVGVVVRLVLATVAGIPIGILVLTRAPEVWVRGALGVVLIAYGGYGLARRHRPRRLAHRGWALPFGFVAGGLGGAYNTSGPPVVIYASTQDWPADQLRATLQGYFLCSSALIATGHALAGLWTERVLGLYALALPAVAAGIVLGSALSCRVDSARFERLLLAAIALMGLLLVAT